MNFPVSVISSLNLPSHPRDIAGGLRERHDLLCGAVAGAVLEGVEAPGEGGVDDAAFAGPAPYSRPADEEIQRGAEEWEPASVFWDAPDRNDHASALWVDEKGTIYHFNGLSAAATWGSLATILRTSKDGGATWEQVARFCREHFGAYFHPTRSGWVYATTCECNPDHSLWLSKDGGDTWEPFETFPFAATQRVQFDPDDPDVIYVTTFGGSVFKGPASPSQ